MSKTHSSVGAPCAATGSMKANKDEVKTQLLTNQICVNLSGIIYQIIVTSALLPLQAHRDLKLTQETDRRFLGLGVSRWWLSASLSPLSPDRQ